MKKTKKIYLPGLNALRFLAASAVIITHIELIKMNFGLKSYWKNPLFFNLGGLGVYFFFVLSGFLITYLLLKEKEVLNTIQIKNFYLRRVLRIWPLYFLILIIGFFVLPHFNQIYTSYQIKNFNQNFYPNLLMYVFILPNLAFSFFPAVPHIGQSWSIGVEEQFYIFWPWLIKKSKNIIKTLFVFIMVMILIKIFYLILPDEIKKMGWYIPIKRFLAMSKLESMAIGGIGAYYLFNNSHKILSIIYHKFVFVFCLFLTIILIYYTPEKLQDGIHLVYSVSFLIIIMNVCSGKLVVTKYLENKTIVHLGNISYGIYMYHLIVIPIVLFFYTKLELKVAFITENLILYPAVFLFTIAISSLSYVVFELKFLRIKDRYSIIPTK